MSDRDDYYDTDIEGIVPWEAIPDDGSWAVMNDPRRGGSASAYWIDRSGISPLQYGDPRGWRKVPDRPVTLLQPVDHRTPEQVAYEDHEHDPDTIIPWRDLPESHDEAIIVIDTFDAFVEVSREGWSVPLEVVNPWSGALRPTTARVRTHHDRGDA